MLGQRITKFVSMKKQRFIPDPVLMIITLIAITGFQLYWLHNNYKDAQRNLEVQTNIAFQETVRGQQIKMLKLNYFIRPDGRSTEKILVLDKLANPRIEPDHFREDEIVTTVSALRKKVPDSVEVKNVVIAMRKDSVNHDSDNAKISFKGNFKVDSDNFVKLELNLDSLHDSLQVPKLTKAYSQALKEGNIDIPFTITQLPKASPEDTVMWEATVGFSHPVTYKLQLGNTFPFLIRKISLPILFSIFLVGITIVSFLVLYKNLLRQRRLAVIKNEFISNMTHELKTPIATVGVAIEALKNFNALHDQQKTKEYLDISSNELQRLGLLVDKVLKLSMLEKKEIDLTLEEINLKDIVQDVINSMKLQIEKYHAMVTLRAEGNTMLQGDKLHLQSVVFNLLDNSLKYSNHSPEINIGLQEKENIIQLRVTDNGIGIPPEYKDKIFEKFFRVPVGDIHDAKGYGLGLSYVAQVIEKHHGTINVDSNPGTGTTFIINIPKTQA